MNLYCVLFNVFKAAFFLAVLLFTTLYGTSNAVVHFKELNIAYRSRKTIFGILPLLRGSHFICFVSRNEQILSEVFEIIKNEYKCLILEDYDTLLLGTCDSVFIIEMDISVSCSGVFSKVSRASVYIINSELTPNDMAHLEQCVANIPSPEVISVSLLDGTVFDLSPVFTSPRRLKKSSVAQVIQRRAHPEKIDLAGTIINAVAINDPPFTIFENKTEKEEFDGPLVVLFKELARQLNFTICYHTYKNWGLLLSNGTFISGMGQAMQKGKADVAVTLVWQIPTSTYLVDLGPPIDMNKMRILVRRPKQIDFQWQTVLGLMEPTVWLATAASFIIVVIAYWSDIKLDHPHTESWAGSILTVFGHFLMTSSHTDNGRNTRYILTSFSSFSLLLSVYYSSIIVTRLTLPTFSPRVNTLRQLVEGGYYWTVQFYGEVHTTDFRESVFDFKDRWHFEFEKTYRYMEAKEVEAKAGFDEKLTFLSDTFGNDIVALKTKGFYRKQAVEMYRVARQVVSTKYVTFGVKKNSPLLEPLTLNALRYVEVGLMKVWMDQVLRRWPAYDTKYLFSEQDTPTFSEAQQLRLQNVLHFFYLLLLGLSFGSLVFVVEAMW